MGQDAISYRRTCRDDSGGVEVEWVEHRCSKCKSWRWIQYFPARDSGRSRQCVFCERRKDRRLRRVGSHDRLAGAKRLKEIMWAEQQKAKAMKAEG